MRPTVAQAIIGLLLSTTLAGALALPGQVVIAEDPPPKGLALTAPEDKQEIVRAAPLPQVPVTATPGRPAPARIVLTKEGAVAGERHAQSQSQPAPTLPAETKEPAPAPPPQPPPPPPASQEPPPPVVAPPPPAVAEPTEPVETPGDESERKTKKAKKPKKAKKAKKPKKAKREPETSAPVAPRDDDEGREHAKGKDKRKDEGDHDRGDRGHEQDGDSRDGNDRGRGDRDRD
jgi:hypothetical protein